MEDENDDDLIDIFIFKAPSGKKKRATVTPMGDSAYRVEWKPVEAGKKFLLKLYNTVFTFKNLS